MMRTEEWDKDGEEKEKRKELNNFTSTHVSQNLKVVSVRKPLRRRHDNLVQLTLIPTHLLWRFLRTLKSIH